MTSRPLTPDNDRAMLDRLSTTMVSTLGFGLAAIALVRPDGRLEVFSAVGNDVVTARLLGSVATRDSWEVHLAATGPSARLRFLQPDCPAPDHHPTALGCDGPHVDDWRPRDAVLMPLVASDGARLGVLAGVITAQHDLPDTATRHAMDAFAVSAGLAIEQASLRAQAEASGAALRSQAMSDPLTGVGTRTLLMERLRHASTARPDSDAALALVFVDLDHFKNINDDHTHEVGDRVLRAVAERIQTAVRAHDTVARWGGDEFLILLDPLADEHSALGAVQRLLTAIAEPIVDAPHTLCVTASIGVSFLTSDAPVEPEELVRRADAAMYEAKSNGGDRLAVFDALDPDSSRRVHLHDVLSRAVDEDRVVVQYQPIIRVADQRVVGVEALLRLRDDNGTLVYPFELLRGGAPPSDVAHAVMRRACEDMTRWIAKGHDLRLSLNVSAPQVAAIDSFVAEVRQAFGAPGLSPDRLTLELTEHTLLNTTPRTLVGIEELVNAGVSFSIDDFGTGYGSMTYLRALPVHELKIDQSFIADMASQHAARAIVRSIASLARDLGIRCVAEGVETLEHHRMVQEAGVPLAQGLHYGAALDADAFEDMLG